jgi:hypothetical protein
MTVDRLSSPRAARAGTTRDIVLDGLFTGMIGALAVAVWFLILDLIAGRPLHTPALLGTILLHGSEAAREATVAPLEIAAYTAFHLVVFVLVGLALSWMMTLFERFPIMFFVILVLFLCLQLAFFGLNVALGARLVGQLRAWTVVVANLLAATGMVLYQWKRHPGVLQSVEKLWEDQST